MSEQPGPGRNVGCLGRVLQLLSGGSGAAGGGGGEPPFVVKDWLLSKAERSFLGVLDAAVAGLEDGGSGVSGGYRVMVKVRLLDVLLFRKGSGAGAGGGGGGEAQAWRNRVDRKHVDFLVVTADALRPVLAVELDDASHRGEKATERDAVKDRVLAAAGLPIVRVTARQSYAVGEVRAALEAGIAGAS